MKIIEDRSFLSDAKTLYRDRLSKESDCIFFVFVFRMAHNVQYIVDDTNKLMSLYSVHVLTRRIRRSSLGVSVLGAE